MESYLFTSYHYIMSEKNKNYLDIVDLLQAEKDGRLFEELQEQRKSSGVSGIKVEAYCCELLEMKANAKPAGLSVDDVKRKVFHSNF